MIVGTAQEAAALLAPVFAASAGEALAVLHLGADNSLLGLTLEPTGGDDEVAIELRSIIAKALALGAAGILLAHNHPSGDPAPSAADEEATRALARAAAALGIRLHDHVIFAGAERTSFRALGLL